MSDPQITALADAVMASRLEYEFMVGLAREEVGRDELVIGLRDALAKDIANVLTAAVLKAAGKFSGF